MRIGGELLEVLPPGIDEPRLDRRLSDVIEHEAHLGAAAHHLDHIGQMMMEDADVEADIVRRQELQPGDEIGPYAELRIGLVLDEPPDSAKNLVLAQLIKLGFDGVAALEWQRGDHVSGLLQAPSNARAWWWPARAWSA